MMAQQNAKKNELDGDHTFCCCCSNEKWKKWGWTWTKCLLHQNSWARSGCGVVWHTFTLSQRNSKGKNFCRFFPSIFVKSVFPMLSKRKHEYSTAHFALKCDTLSLFHREMLKTKQTFAGFSSYFPDINIFDAQQKETAHFALKCLVPTKWLLMFQPMQCNGRLSQGHVLSCSRCFWQCAVAF